MELLPLIKTLLTAVTKDVLCKSLKLEVIHPKERHIYTETIMDVCPIATKVEGELAKVSQKLLMVLYLCLPV